MSSFEIEPVSPQGFSNSYGRKIAARIEERLKEHRATSSETKTNHAEEDLLGLLSEKKQPYRQSKREL